MNTNNDGRKKMPKSRCPYCDSRVVDSRTPMLKNSLELTVKSNKFFIENLFATIDIPQWEVAHKICEVAVRFGFAEDVATFIKSIDYKDDNSAKERYDFLLTKKLKGGNQ